MISRCTLSPRCSSDAYSAWRASIASRYSAAFKRLFAALSYSPSLSWIVALFSQLGGVDFELGDCCFVLHGTLPVGCHPKQPSREGCSVMLSVLLPPERRGALLAGSFTRFWRFTIEQPSRLFLSLAGFRACLNAGRW